MTVLRFHLQLEFGNIAVSSGAVLQAAPLGFGSFSPATMAAKIRYGALREAARQRRIRKSKISDV